MDPSESEPSGPVFSAFEEASWWRNVLDELPDPVVAWSADGGILYGNRALLNLTGHDNIGSLHIDDLFRETSVPLTAEKSDVSSDRFRVPYNAHLVTSRGTSISCSVRFIRVDEGDGHVRCALIRAASNKGSSKGSLRDYAQKYRRLFEESQEAITLTSAEGTIIDVNPAVARLTGYDRDELLGMPASTLYAAPEERDEFLEALRRKGEVHGAEVRIRHKDGRDVLCRVNATAWMDESGDLEGIQSFARDITEQRHGEEQFRHLVQEVREYAIFMLDREGYVISWNEGAERIKGYAEDEIVGSHFSRFYTSEAVDAGIPRRALETAVEVGQWSSEGWRVRKDGSRFWAHVTITALSDEAGDVHGFAKVTRDMTERRTREIELEKQKSRAEEAKKRAEQETALLRLMQAVASTANDADSLDGALQDAVVIICQHLEWPVGHVYWVQPERRPEVESSGIWYLEDGERFRAFQAVTEDAHFSLNESLPGRAASEGKPVWVRDVTEEPVFIRGTSAQDLGVRGAFAFPVRFGDDAVAVLEFFSESEEPQNERLIEAMDSVGVQLSRVAEREAARKDLRRSERRYRRLFEASQEGIVIQASDRTVTDINPAGLEILGYDRVDLVGSRPDQLFVDAKQRQRLQDQIDEQGQLRDIEISLRRKDGSVVICEATSSLQRGDGEDAGTFYTIFRDVTERKKMQEALEASEKRYRRLFEESRDAIILTRTDGTILNANGAAVSLFGYSREDLLDLNAARLYADPTERARRIVPEIEETNSSRLLEAEMRHSDGHTFLATASVTVHRDEEDEPELIQALVRDITERRRLEKELLQIQDQERQRLGQELHDGVSSLLTAASIKISTLAEAVRTGEAIEPEDLDEATEFVKQAGEEARAVSHGLSPVGLERGLRTALEDLASQNDVRGEGTCSFDGTESLPDLDEETATHIYRVAQEAVSNAVTHADAETIDIELRVDDGALLLTVRDDGIGFSASTSEGEGIGMRTMRYRANLIKGTLTVEERETGGTEIRCRVPLGDR